MKANKQKLELAMAGKCMNPYDVCREAGISYQSFRRVAGSGHGVKPRTLGRVAAALGVDVTEIMEEG